jgi:hypothetical protein
MSENSQIIQRAASFDWETLLPVVFFVLYGLAQFLGSRKKGDAAEDGADPEEDPMEKARQIREEIRRKIEQRKQTAGQPASRDTTAPQRGYGYDPNQPESRQARHQQQSQPAQKPRPVVVHQAQPVATQPRLSNIEERLHAEQKRLREARKQHDAAMVQARKMTREASVKRQSDSRKLFEPDAVGLDGSGKLRTDVIYGLRHPNSLRQAILYREILGPPVGLR